MSVMEMSWNSKLSQICLCNEIKSSGSTLLFLYLELDCTQNIIRCLSVIILDSTVEGEDREKSRISKTGELQILGWNSSRLL